jgi:hypothetical protein
MLPVGVHVALNDEWVAGLQTEIELDSWLVQYSQKAFSANPHVVVPGFASMFGSQRV